MLPTVLGDAMNGVMARLHSLPLRWLAIVVWGVVNGVLIAYAFEAFLLRPGSENDWGTWQTAALGLESGTLYADGFFVWSPIAAWLMGHVVLPLGYWFWLAAHLAIVLLLRSPLLIVAVLTSGPFWIDAAAGNFFTFVAVAGFLAVSGSRPAGIAFLALSLLMPRPVQLPLSLWLLAHERGLWVPTIGLIAGFAVLVGLSGYAIDWMHALLSLGQSYPFRGWDLGPTRVLGGAWLIIGIPLGAWLLYRGRPAWAGLAVTPYLVPQYFLALVWEAGKRSARGRTPGPILPNRP